MNQFDQQTLLGIAGLERRTGHTPGEHRLHSPQIQLAVPPLLAVTANTLGFQNRLHVLLEVRNFPRLLVGARQTRCQNAEQPNKDGSAGTHEYREDHYAWPTTFTKQ